MLNTNMAMGAFKLTTEGGYEYSFETDALDQDQGIIFEMAIKQALDDMEFEGEDLSEIVNDAFNQRMISFAKEYLLESQYRIEYLTTELLEEPVFEGFWV